MASQTSNSALKMPFFHLFLFASLINYAVGDEVRIGNVDEFIQFKENINGGTRYYGTTVFLDCDLDLSGKTINYIGSLLGYFLGTFDGQGYTISNLAMNSSLNHAGLFGYSKGLTVRDVVLDTSCSFTCSYVNSDKAYVGGFIGYCEAYNGPCTVENSVNMGSVSFAGNIGAYSLYLGGIAGYPKTSSYEPIVKNCANYGDVKDSGTSGYSYIGGIVGYSYGDPSGNWLKMMYIRNSLSHGTITYSGTTSNSLSLGAITGYSYYTKIENCVVFGKIESTGTATKDYIGSIVGSVSSGTLIKYCYTIDELSSYSKYGYTEYTPSESNVFDYYSFIYKLYEAASIGSYSGTSLIDALNAYADYYALSDYSHWLLNKNRNTFTFIINGKTSTSMNYQIILLPSLASKWSLSFDGWYEDSSLTTPLISYEATSGAELYGKWEEGISYTITLDTKREGVTVEPITAQFGSVVTLPSESIREHCSVGFWETDLGYYIGTNLTMPARNITLCAVWKCTHLKTPEDLVDLSRVVNKGLGAFEGTTVLLDSDLDLAGKTIEPIGNSSSNYFLGTFDGQGHVISNLAVSSSSSYYAGLFGYSAGLAIRNVILDSSCSITGLFKGSYNAYVGGFVGGFSASSGSCTIENSVIMGSVSFSGNVTGYYLYLGGIAGYASSRNFEMAVKNCANYGGVTHSGASDISSIGGIAGCSSGSSPFNGAYIQNCLNYGTVKYSGTFSNVLYLGGIVGLSYSYTSIENCVSSGKISSPRVGGIRSIVGYVSSGTSISYCYTTSELGSYKKCGGNTPSSESNIFNYSSTTFELDETASIGSYTGTSLINALNAYADYYILRDYSNWLLNKDSSTVKFTINGRTSPISMSYQIMLLPSLASEGSLWFDGWYEDNSYATPLASYEVTSDTSFYGKWGENTNSYTITFNARRDGVVVLPITAQFGSVVILPNISTIDGNCSVGVWENVHGDNVGTSLAMPAHNITLYAFWKCTHIKTPEDLIEFSNAVNRGVDYAGTTVFLDSDLDLTEKTFEPIGSSTSSCFRGVFDGQGHVISNLAMNSSSSQHAGLFGYSTGLTIRNVILDSSCSFASSYSYGSSTICVGGLISECYANNGPCTIENNVNMGSISFTGSIKSNVYLGGISGVLYSSINYYSTVKNCANYGDITDSGESYRSYIGGVVGYSYGPSSTNRVYAYNSLNHGAITHRGTALLDLNVGGISGYAYFATIENCVSVGNIESAGTTGSNYFGGIAGYVYFNGVYITHCIWTSDVKCDVVASGPGSPVVTGTSLITTLNTTTMNELNEYAESQEDSDTWSRWVMLHLNGGTISSISQDTQISGLVKSLPVPVKEEHTLDYWCLDEACNEKYDPSTTEMSGVTDLYAHWRIKVQFTLTFEVNGGSECPSITQDYDTPVTLPEPTKVGYTFDYWCSDIELNTKFTETTMPAENKTLYAKWNINQYTITFEVNGGSACSSITQDYDTPVTLPEPTKTGYTFVNWCSDIELNTKFTATTMPAENKILYAKWTINQYTITFDFGNGTVNSIVLDFNETIEYPENIAEREGFNFTGWSPEPERMPAEDITVKAQWSATISAVTAECVEVVFSSLSLTKKEVEKIVKEFVPEGTEFTIVKFESDSGETTVVVKFTSEETASEFVEAVTVSSDVKKSGIKSIGFVPGGCSFSSSLGLSTLIYFLSYFLLF